MLYINYSRISRLMCHATKQVVHAHCKEWLDKNHPHAKLEFIVGSGNATYHQKQHRRLHHIVYGAGMIESKLKSKTTCANWTTGHEIRTRGYWGGDLSIQNALVHTCLHEYAHYIQVLKGDRTKGSVHNQAFYNILDRMYYRGIHEKLKSFMMQYPEFKELSYVSTSEPEEVRQNVSLGCLVSFQGRKKQILQGKVSKINKKTVSVDVGPENWRIPYANILSID